MAIKHEAIERRGASLYNVYPKQIIVENGWNPRTDFSGQEELANSIRENGVQLPLTVKKTKQGIVLVNGERRLRATLWLIENGCDITTVPCIFTRPNISEPEAMLMALIANDGKPLDPIEQAEAFNRLRGWGLSVAQISRKTGRSDVFVYRRLTLVDASEDLKKEIKSKNIKLTDAEKIIKESSGKVLTQAQKASAKMRSNRLTFKEIETRFHEKRQEYFTDKTYFLAGYIRALENVMDKRTIKEG